MPVVARFEVPYTQFLDPSGRVVAPMPEFAADPRTLIAAYRAMVLMRLFDAKAIALQRTGRLGTYASTLGREAIDAGVGTMLAPSDVLLPSYREVGILMMRGVPLERTLLYWGGDERGNVLTESPHDFPFCVPVASHLPHAAGVAHALKERKTGQVALAMCGDGATSKGDFYEALNAAGTWRLPLVVLVVNNEYAISMPRRMQSAALTLAQKGIAAGIDAEQLDGNDLIAVCDALARALQRARAGAGPTLIEACSYRLSDHTTADDASRYRSADELADHWQREPILRLRNWLHERGVWSKEDEKALHRECTSTIEKAVASYLATPPPPVDQMFEHVYGEYPTSYGWQRDSVTRSASASHAELHTR